MQTSQAQFGLDNVANALALKNVTGSLSQMPKSSLEGQVPAWSEFMQVHCQGTQRPSSALVLGK